MTRFVFGDSLFFVVIQWFLLVLYCGVFLFFGSKLLQLSVIPLNNVLIYFCLAFLFGFVGYHKVLKINIIEESGDTLCLTNFWRKKRIKKDEIENLRINWFWLNGYLSILGGKKFFFPLDADDIKKVLFFNISEIEEKYKRRLSGVGIFFRKD